MDPNYALQKALIKQLREGNVVLNGAIVPVYANAPESAAAPFIILDQVSEVAVSGAMGCKSYELVYQLTVLTSFQVQNQVTDGPSLLIAGQLRELLDQVSLPLDGGYTMTPLHIAQTRKLARKNQVAMDVLRYLTVKASLYLDN